jgi:DNA (cytosine-5)-methyltransferase 1
MLTHFSLFTGIGGLDLAAEWAGFKTVGQCEWADYPTKVLEKHWPDVPKWRDIRSVTRESFTERTGLRTVDIISGGFPCQPFSRAGQRKGEDDDRYLWPEMVRVIQEFKPNWVVGENVAGIIDMALDQVLVDLENSLYSTQTFIIPACAQNAPHRRDRVFIIANNNNRRCVHGENEKHSTINQFNPQHEPDKLPGINSYFDSELCKRDFEEKILRRRGIQSSPHHGSTEEWTRRCSEFEPKLLRNFHGIPNGVDRIKCLGNAVSPLHVYPIFQAIADIEGMMHT